MKTGKGGFIVKWGTKNGMKDFNDEGNALRVQPISKGNVRDVNVPNHTQNAQLSNENNVVPQGYGSHTKQMNNQNNKTNVYIYI